MLPSSEGPGVGWFMAGRERCRLSIDRPLEKMPPYGKETVKFECSTRVPRVRFGVPPKSFPLRVFASWCEPCWCNLTTEKMTPHGKQTVKFLTQSAPRLDRGVISPSPVSRFAPQNRESVGAPVSSPALGHRRLFQIRLPAIRLPRSFPILDSTCAPSRLCASFSLVPFAPFGGESRFVNRKS
jgi:hypothetical protein